MLIYGHRLGRVPVQFLALAVVAKAENNQNCLNSPGVLERFDHVVCCIVTRITMRACKK